MTRHIYPGNSFNPPRPVFSALRRGWNDCCPNCGRNGLIHGLLGLRKQCPDCRQDMSAATINGALQLFLIPAAFLAAMLSVVALEFASTLIFAVNLDVWIFQAVAIVVALYSAWRWAPRFAGALASLQWALWVEGFDPDFQESVFPTAVQIGAHKSSSAPNLAPAWADANASRHG